VKVEAAVFDLDGTLVAFKFDVKGTRQSIISELSNRGFDTSELDQTTPTQTMVDAAREQIETGKASASFNAVRSMLYTILDASEIATSSETKVFPDTRETLDYLKSRGVRLGVLTNSGRRAAMAILDRAELQSCFEFVLCRDDVAAMKPRPDGITMAISMFGIPKNRVVYVGDSKYDIIAAKEAGIRIVAISSGNYGVDSLLAEGADYVIRTIAGLPGILGLSEAAQD